MSNDVFIPCYKNQTKFVFNNFVPQKKKSEQAKLSIIYRYFVIVLVVVIFRWLSFIEVCVDRDQIPFKIINHKVRIAATRVALSS
jgi:hypothetical protein